MNDRLFMKILFAITAVGLISVVLLVAYTYYLYGAASIISYIANGR